MGGVNDDNCKKNKLKKWTWTRATTRKRLMVMNKWKEK